MSLCLTMFQNSRIFVRNLLSSKKMSSCCNKNGIFLSVLSCIELHKIIPKLINFITVDKFYSINTMHLLNFLFNYSSLFNFYNPFMYFEFISNIDCCLILYEVSCALFSSNLDQNIRFSNYKIQFNNTKFGSTFIFPSSYCGLF